MIMKVKAIGLLASIVTLCACGSGQIQQEQVQQYPVIQVNKSSILFGYDGRTSGCGNLSAGIGNYF